MTGHPDRLGMIDEAYLVVEGPDEPLHVASIGLFEQGPLVEDGHFRIDDVRAHMAANLGLLPRLRQRIAQVPFDLSRPVWVDDEQFDIANHVDVVELGPPHDEAALLALVEELVMQPLDRSRPLWHLRFVTGLDGDRVALIERAHHAMVDGVSGVDVSLVLLDATPEPPEVPVEAWKPDPTPSPAALLVQAAIDRARAPLEAAVAAARALSHPVHLSQQLGGMAHTTDLLRTRGLLAPECSINAALGGRRRLTLVRQRLDAVRGAGAPTGATVNDVVLTAVAGGLRGLFLARHERLEPDRVVKVLVPVSVRSGDESMALGNRVGGLIAPLPIGIGDPEARLRAVAGLTRDLKASTEASTTDLALQAADLLPPSVAHVLAHGVERQPFVNMVVTNVPGPPFPLYALGARMLEAFPVVPLGARMTLEVAVLSYDGALNLCITSDPDACPDVDEFRRGIEDTFRSLHATWSAVV